jgi:hypothetical protein
LRLANGDSDGRGGKPGAVLSAGAVCELEGEVGIGWAVEGVSHCVRGDFSCRCRDHTEWVGRTQDFIHGLFSDILVQISASAAVTAHLFCIRARLQSGRIGRTKIWALAPAFLTQQDELPNGGPRVCVWLTAIPMGVEASRARSCRLGLFANWRVRLGLVGRLRVFRTVYAGISAVAVGTTQSGLGVHRISYMGYFQTFLSKLALLRRSRPTCFVSGHDFSRAVSVEQKSGL